MDNRQLEIYTDYLIRHYGYATATGLSAMVNGAASHDKNTRFLSDREYTSKDLWHGEDAVSSNIHTFFRPNTSSKDRTDSSSVDTSGRIRVTWKFYG